MSTNNSTDGSGPCFAKIANVPFPSTLNKPCSYLSYFELNNSNNQTEPVIHQDLTWTPLKYIKKIHIISIIQADMMIPMQGISKWKCSQWHFQTCPHREQPGKLLSAWDCTQWWVFVLSFQTWNEPQLMSPSGSDKLTDTLLPIFFAPLFLF